MIALEDLDHSEVAPGTRDDSPGGSGPFSSGMREGEGRRGRGMTAVDPSVSAGECIYPLQGENAGFQRPQRGTVLPIS